ncbi:glycosyl transferase [Acidaminobacter sp. JC074]|uniref:GH36-type glycosyl hydrolase domain-containing protein n=1 Tax=Acidaminobacter sp. JC074 TaxID=2530199 RepID=UPI001F0D6825|nr:glycosyl transferase [Acidaminobacter sp. JC074]MCH4886176.1 glycosyl transferase [Acidaminobacter sp. JC074]
MKYGYFDDKNREYIITSPQVPTKWINYIGTLSFGGFVDHLGGGVICKDDPAINRITKYIPQLPDSHFNGETAYIKVYADNETFVFSPYIVPTLHDYESYACAVGLGYNIYRSSYKGIETEVKVFVPKDMDVVIRDYSVKIKRNDVNKIEIIPLVEYTHFEALKQFTNADWVPHTMVSDMVDLDGIVLKQYAFMNKETAVNYFTSNGPITSFETDRRRFLKDNQGGSFRNPKSLEENEFSNYEARRGDNIAALRHTYQVDGMTEINLITQLGQTRQLESIKSQINFCRDKVNVDILFSKLRSFWEDYLSVMQVNTPDQEMNSLLNIHNPKQCYMTKNWSRYLSLYQLGLGARGIGIRDTSQDVMGIIAFMPNQAKSLIETLLSMQRRDGSAYHQYNPKSLIASIGDAHEDEDAPDYYGDDHLWLVLVTSAYIKETGDYSFLDKIIPFYDKDKKDEPIESATVMEHLKRAFHFTENDLGKNKLPHLGFADWNDPTNLPTGSESVFNANLYGYGMKSFIDMLNYLEMDSKDYSAKYDRMKENFNAVAWDGRWFKRYFDQNGLPLGSKDNDYGQIYTNAQSWSVMSGFADDDKGRMAMDSVHDILNTDFGVKLSYPGFNGYDPVKGGISSYPPGAKENGGIFLHANPWVMYAETLLGDGDRAYKYYSQINPIKKNDIIDTYELAPYVYAQNILGNEHELFGLARNCWLSGTASWSYQVATQFILGIQASFEGLRINPCIPKNWPGFDVVRKFRNSTYHIQVMNPQKVSKGVKALYVNDEKLESDVLPFGQETYNVKVILGE